MRTNQPASFPKTFAGKCFDFVGRNNHFRLVLAFFGSNKRYPKVLFHFPQIFNRSGLQEYISRIPGLRTDMVFKVLKPEFLLHGNFDEGDWGRRVSKNQTSNVQEIGLILFKNVR